MVWVQADKAASGSARLFPVAVFVIGVNQLKLGLFGVGAERIASIQGFKALDSNREAVAIECGACQLIQLALLYPRKLIFLLRGRVVASAARQEGKAQG